MIKILYKRKVLTIKIVKITQIKKKQQQLYNQRIR